MSFVYSLLGAVYLVVNNMYFVLLFLGGMVWLERRKTAKKKEAKLKLRFDF